MKQFLLLLTLGCSMTIVQAESVSWLEEGNAVSATQDEKATKSLNEAPQVTLATGETATLTGNVYVKTSDRAAVLTWAIEQGYIATLDPYIDDAVHIEVTAHQSLEVANQVAAISGVTTAAPQYQASRVAK